MVGGRVREQPSLSFVRPLVRAECVCFGWLCVCVGGGGWRWRRVYRKVGDRRERIPGFLTMAGRGPGGREKVQGPGEERLCCLDQNDWDPGERQSRGFCAEGGGGCVLPWGARPASETPMAAPLPTATRPSGDWGSIRGGRPLVALASAGVCRCPVSAEKWGRGRPLPRPLAGPPATAELSR